MSTINLISISGGKDSTATLLKAIEDEAENIKAVFADTGHEHEKTYQYIDYLQAMTGIKIERIKPDFSKEIERKRETVKTKWVADGVSQEQIESALEALKPSGIPFLDMAMWKGRFPSSQARFCTEELKKKPIMAYQESIMAEHDRMNVWVGVRRDESIARSKITEAWELEFGNTETGEGMWIYRPILDWSVEEVFAMHKKHGIEPNPLYKMGMGRVGCMPCVMCRKSELKAIGDTSPAEIDRLESWEYQVSKASRIGKATFFNTGTIHGIKDAEAISVQDHGIRSAVKWSQTSRGGRQYNFFDIFDDSQQCTSVYGLCE